uniref:Uncharacterized protein n=1 Tax=viral metagenome TaxID=1070528 RepID=A0A6M3X877_9ZZZZ
MTFDEIKTAVRELLGEPVADQWSDTQVARYINYAASEIWRELMRRADHEWGWTSGSAISIVSGTQEYSLPSDMLLFRAIERVNIDDPYFLSRVRIQDRGKFTSISASGSSYPSRFYLRPPSYFGLAPKPTASIASALKVWYVPVATEMSLSADEPEIPEQHHRLIVFRAAIMARRAQEQNPGGLISEFKEGLAEAIVSMSQTGEEASYGNDTSEDWSY